MAQAQEITLEHMNIQFRNFSGAAGQFNKEGDRNFCVLFDTDELIALAEQLVEDGWNVKRLHPSDPAETRQPYMQVKVNFNGYRPPKIVMVSSAGKTQLTPETVNILDWADIEFVDMIISPYEWEVNGRTGVSAYLKTMYVTIHEDELEKKYYDAPDSGINTMGSE